MPVPKQLVEFLDVLTKNTQENKVSWMEPTRSGRFTTEIAGVAVQIWKWSRTYLDESGILRDEDVISLQLFSGDSHEIIGAEVGSSESEYGALEDLHQSALVRARDVGNVVSKLLARLKAGPIEQARATAATTFPGTLQVRFASTSSTRRGVELFVIAGNSTYRTYSGASYEIAEVRRNEPSSILTFEKRGIQQGKRTGQNRLRIIDAAHLEGEELMNPGGEIFKVAYEKVAEGASSDKPNPSDILMGKWKHTWERHTGQVVIDRQMNYYYEGEGAGPSAKKHFKVENIRYAEGRITFTLKDAASGAQDSVQAVDLINGNLLQGCVEGQPQNTRVYART